MDFQAGVLGQEEGRLQGARLHQGLAQHEIGLLQRDRLLRAVVHVPVDVGHAGEVQRILGRCEKCPILLLAVALAVVLNAPLDDLLRVVFGLLVDL
eukprot:5584476-Pyramimonas_sp.AAC.1